MAGSAVATIKGGFFEQYGTTLAQVASWGAKRHRVSQWLSKKSSRDIRARMLALNGVAAGATASATQGRVQANAELGGKRVIETETIINRATTAADVTEINLDILNSITRTYTASPVANKDGNPLGTR